MDVTEYLGIYKVSPRELAKRIIRTVLEETGITATAGIGTNLYLCKVAMDIVAKHVEADKDGVRIAELDEQSYRELLWTHEPLTDFWRVGPGYQKKLWQAGLRTMGDIARCSLGKSGEFYSEELLHQMFGVNAELLIDHAWGYEPCTIAQIRAYKPQSSSLGCGQVLHCPYTADKARIVVQEMIDGISLELVEKDTSLILFYGEDETRPLMDRVLKFSKTVSDEITIFDTKEVELPFTDPEFRKIVSPIVIYAMTERLSAHLAKERNHPLTTRRYYRQMEY